MLLLLVGRSLSTRVCSRVASGDVAAALVLLDMHHSNSMRARRTYVRMGAFLSPAEPGASWGAVLMRPLLPFAAQLHLVYI